MYVGKSIWLFLSNFGGGLNSSGFWMIYWDDLGLQLSKTIDFVDPPQISLSGVEIIFIAISSKCSSWTEILSKLDI